MIEVRPAAPGDAAAITAIHNQGIAGRGATFDTTPRTVEDSAARIRDAGRHPLLVAVEGGTVVGWAGLYGYRPRDCYAGIAEFSVYVEAQARGRGIGRQLLQALIEAAATAGFWKLVSRVFPFNHASRAACRAAGFREVGTYEKHARLDGRWLDVVIVERLIPENLPSGHADFQDPPTETLPAGDTHPHPAAERRSPEEHAMHAQLPVVVIGAGPVGLAAAAHLLERGLVPLVLEAGDGVGAGMRGWSHVHMFSPWEFNIDRAARALLDAHGWNPPDPARFPTGGELIEHYLQPLAALPGLAPHLRLGTRVQAVTRQRHDRMKHAHRSDVPFLVHYEDAAGEHVVLAQAVIDASGTMDTPSPLGASGVPALGERALRDRIAYGMPDVLGADRARYAGKRVLVVGSGHSAFNVLQDLASLTAQAPGTEIQWALRRGSLQRVLGGGDADQLRERGALGQRIGRLVDEGSLRVATGFHVERLHDSADGIVVLDGERALAPVDEIVVATGFRPDTSLLSELRIALDHGTQAPVALAPLIDPNLHSCGSVRPHGAIELAHPDPGVYIVGMKSYGRAPTFLLVTGYEQVRSVAAALAGDWEAARRVELVLPETGVCGTQFAGEEGAEAAMTCCGPAPATGGCGSTGSATPPPAEDKPAEPAAACCGGPAPDGVDACCVRDADAKASGKTGCGCGSRAPAAAPEAACCG